MRAVIYARTSTNEQVLGIEMQLELCREWCRRNSIEIIGEYYEHVSGSVPARQRPVFSKLLQQVEKDRPDYLVVYSLDRLSRSIYDVISIMIELSEKGTAVMPISQLAVYDVPHPTLRKLMLLMMAAFGELFLQEHRRRVRDAMRCDQVREKIVKHSKIHNLPPEVKKLIVEKYVNGCSIYSIARELGLSRYLVQRVLIEAGIVTVGWDVCPRCLHRLRYDPVDDAYRCPNCGYIRAREHSQAAGRSS